MPSAADDLAAASRDAGRPLRFDEYLAIVLYGEHGFYSVAGQAGRRGDFLTSPEVGPLFGVVLSRWIAAEYERLGRPADFTIVEAGAGPGTLARAVLAAAPQWRGRYVAVELSAAQRAQHPDGVVSQVGLPDNPFVGVIIANELLDNLPFRLAVFDGGWREAMVRIDPQGSLAEVTVAADPAWSAWLPPHSPHGARVPIHDAAAAWVVHARSLLVGGTVLAIDYFSARTAALALSPWRTWLRTYRGHGSGEHYLRNPGWQDVTTQVCLDQLPEPTAMRSQAQFLQRWGIDELVAEGRRGWAASAAAPSLAAVRLRSRIREAEALLDPAGLGSFLTVEW